MVFSLNGEFKVYCARVCFSPYSKNSEDRYLTRPDGYSHPCKASSRRMQFFSEVTNALSGSEATLSTTHQSQPELHTENIKICTTCRPDRERRSITNPFLSMSQENVHGAEFCLVGYDVLQGFVHLYLDARLDLVFLRRTTSNNLLCLG